MNSILHAQNERSYGCTFGCGNPYDIIIISVSDATTELLCMPCYIRMATELLTAFMDEMSPELKAALEAMPQAAQVPMNGSKPKPRGKNAPATTDDPDVLEAFESVITVDELPDEFR